MSTTMRAAVFQGKGKIGLREVPRPVPGIGQALIKVTLTTICGTDVHILKGEYPVREGLVVGHEPVGRDRGARPGRHRVPEGRPGHRRRHHTVRPVPRLPDRRRVPVRPRRLRLGGHGRLAVREHHRRLPGGVRSGSERAGKPGQDPDRADGRRGASLSGHHVDRLLGGGARACPPGRLRGGVRARADRSLRDGRGRLAGASLVIAVDSVPSRLEFARRMGADVVLDFKEQDVVAEVKRLTDGGADVAIEALGSADVRSCLRWIRPGGTLSSLGVYSGHLTVPLDAYAAGLGDQTIVSSLCPGGKERMRRLMSVVAANRFPFKDLVTHPFRWRTSKPRTISSRTSATA